MERDDLIALNRRAMRLNWFMAALVVAGMIGNLMSAQDHRQREEKLKAALAAAQVNCAKTLAEARKNGEYCPPLANCTVRFHGSQVIEIVTEGKGILKLKE